MAKAKAASKAPKGFEQIHYILGAVLREVERTHWPARFHLGGPMPSLSYVAQLRVGKMLVAAARPLATNVRAFDKIAALVDTPLPPEGARHVARIADAYDGDTALRASDSPAEKVARLAARARFHWRFATESARNTTGKCITKAAITLAQTVHEPGAFLVALDQAIVREELRDKLDERTIAPSHPIARVVSRPGTGKSFGLALVELEDRSYGLFVKLKNTWQWHEGDKATVFATVPDAYMEQVAEDLG